MKGICVENHKHLTIGEKYEILNYDNEKYIVTDDLGDLHPYKKFFFKIIDEVILESINERKEIHVYTDREKAVKTLFSTGWITRDNDIYNTINVHTYEPTRRTDDGWWHSDDCELSYRIPTELFSWLKWDSEPLNLKDIK